ncbi:MAG TPA: hypothetical protein P5120_17260 [Spirochaetota bacterium]|nr:hypothetical protein [Spirochaetota bacterium]HPF07412.1 hypothetical protein [Spirochaetota bacterium]HPJ44162.1 hypothetical protein [Spirochaetota bacterium]HPR38687.1 hypothetical protein [Spirochaetota bacterium]HRX49272.1 hypothetical protein [Spirochaetota bacterium]
MKKKFSIFITVMLFSAIAFAISALAAGEKSAREICFRKCSEEMDRCADKPGMTRIKCAKQLEECEESCRKLLAK